MEEKNEAIAGFVKVKKKKMKSKAIFLSVFLHSNQKE